MSFRLFVPNAIFSTSDCNHEQTYFYAVYSLSCSSRTRQVVPEAIIIIDRCRCKDDVYYLFYKSFISSRPSYFIWRTRRLKHVNVKVHTNTSSKTTVSTQSRPYQVPTLAAANFEGGGGRLRRKTRQSNLFIHSSLSCLTSRC